MPKRTEIVRKMKMKNMAEDENVSHSKSTHLNNKLQIKSRECPVSARKKAILKSRWFLIAAVPWDPGEGLQQSEIETHRSTPQEPSLLSLSLSRAHKHLTQTSPSPPQITNPLRISTHRRFLRRTTVSFVPWPSSAMPTALHATVAPPLPLTVSISSPLSHIFFLFTLSGFNFFLSCFLLSFFLNSFIIFILFCWALGLCTDLTFILVLYYCNPCLFYLFVWFT